MGYVFKSTYNKVMNLELSSLSFNNVCWGTTKRGKWPGYDVERHEDDINRGFRLKNLHEVSFPGNIGISLAFDYYQPNFLCFPSDWLLKIHFIQQNCPWFCNRIRKIMYRYQYTNRWMLNKIRMYSWFFTLWQNP